MAFSNDGGNTWSTPETYSTTKAYTFIGDSGNDITVRVRFFDVNGNYSASDGCSASINYNSTLTDSDVSAINAVIAQIAALPAVGNLVLSDKTAVESARTAYNALSTSQKTFVTNYATLTAAEARIVALKVSFTTTTLFRSGQHNWGVSSTKYTVSGDFDGDGTDELAAMYDYGNNDMAIIVFDGDGTSKTSATWFRSGPNNWGVPYTKYLVAGDFNGDGKDEIAAMYDYGNNDMSMIVFTSATPGTFTSASWFRTGVNNWGVPYTKYVTAGDFNGDGKAEIAAMYDYGSNDMSMIVFTSATPGTFTSASWFRTGVNNWGVAYTKYVTAGDFNGDGKAELAAMYDYGSNDMSMIVFTSATPGTFTSASWFRTGVNNWGVAYTKFVTAGDFNGDHVDEISAFYDYGTQDMGLIMFK
jgi:hypothetical protein